MYYITEQVMKKQTHSVHVKSLLVWKLANKSA